jgi:protein required for attachment to host cells
MATTWIIAADSSRARILQVLDREQRLSEIEDLYNPGGRLHERDLNQDAEPRFSGHGGVGRPGSSPTGGPASDRETKGAVDHEVEMFAKKIGEYLDKARTAHRYDRLHLIAPPKFLGQLRKELGKEVQKLVTEEMPKDLSWLTARDLEQKLLEPRAKGNARAP